MTREGAHDSLHEVLKMNSKYACDCQVVQEDVPVHPGLKVVRLNDPDRGLSDDEILERNEFIHWYIQQDFALVMMIPGQAENDFFIVDCDPTSSDYSAFNTHDYQRMLRPFNKYGYAMKKIMERIKDLAIMHSVVSSPEAREQVHKRYKSLVEIEFRSRLTDLVNRYRNTSSELTRFSLKQRIGEINRRIIECKKIWEQYAPWDS